MILTSHDLDLDCTFLALSTLQVCPFRLYAGALPHASYGFLVF